MNLFLYIPSHSAHTPGLLKSLACGLISTYKRQNSSNEDFKLNIKRLFDRLLARGYKIETLEPLVKEVAGKLDQSKVWIKGSIPNTDINSIQPDSPLFFHLPFHPKGISRRFIQQTYKETCESLDVLGESFRQMKSASGGVMSILKLTVAYSRAKNLRDILTPSKLKEFENCSVQKFLDKHHVK